MTTYSAVVTTGIYCRPGCGAKPLAENVRTFEHAAAAEAAGFRACHRCRPYRVAGPITCGEPELVCHVVQLIIDGALDDGGTEQDLATRVGMSARHVRRLFVRHVGATPDQLARSRRAHFARRLLDDTDLTVIDVAFASGYGSLRQFNRAMTDVFGASPTDLRSRRRRADRLVADGGLELRLPVPPAYDWDATRAFLAVRAVPGVESVTGATYRRTISVAGEPGLLEVSPGDPGHLRLRVHLPYWEGLIHLVGRVGQFLGADLDYGSGVTALQSDPVLGPLIRRRPGLAVPGAWTAFEVGVWAILSGAGPASLARDLPVVVSALGRQVAGLPDGLTHLFPAPEVVSVARLTRAGLPEAQATAIAVLATAITRTGPGQDLPPGLDEDLREYLAFRLGRRSAFPLADPSLGAALADVGLADASLGAALADVGLAAPGAWRESWQPWLALAAAHLMAHGDGLDRPNRVAPLVLAWRS
jgi:AraC family transcriptional regulator, regulatory protein of adaptative response / DNA-3-methyladenine glycosylase II